ncbi:MULTISPECIES: hypothetical protein [unclassified Streptomyces]|uniref:hypothetical protein n=1 Tax=unclassified Streptomyces TaxID=2593676 RepID=UPI0035DDFB9A
MSTFIAPASPVAAVMWRPGHIGSGFDPAARAASALTPVAVARICVAVSFAVAFQADHPVEDARVRDFPGEENPIRGDYGTPAVAGPLVVTASPAA